MRRQRFTIAGALWLEFPIRHFLVGGTGVAKFLEKPDTRLPLRNRSRRATCDIAGIPSISKIHQRRSRKQVNPRPKLLYVMTNLGGDVRYLNFHMYPDIAFARFQREVVKACVQPRDRPQVFVKIYSKSGPRCDLLANPIVETMTDLKCLGFDIEWDATTPFRDLAVEADTIVTDVPHTCLLEAVATEAQVFTLADRRWMRYSPQALELLSRRATVTESFEDCIHEIRSANLGRAFAKHDDAYLRAYGLNTLEGDEVEQGVQLIEKLIRG